MVAGWVIKMKLLLLILLCATAASAQSGISKTVQSGGTLPATCNAGTGSHADIFIKTGASAGFYYCSSANTWSQVTGGSGSPGGSPTQVQFNDSGSFGGDAGLVYNKTTDALTTGTLTTTGDGSGAAGGLQDVSSGTAFAGTANKGEFWFDSSGNRFMMNNNNGGAVNVIGTTDVPYDVAMSYDGVPASSSTFRFVAPRAFDPAASWVGTVCSAGTAATAQADFLVKVNGTTKATLRFAASGTTCTIVSPTTVAIAATDVITIIAPASADATLANIAVTLKGVLH